MLRKNSKTVMTLNIIKTGREIHQKDHHRFRLERFEQKRNFKTQLSETGLI